MKNYWLYCGIGVLLAGLSNNFVYRIIILTCYGIFLKYVVNKKVFWKIFGCLLLFILCSIPFSSSLTKGRVKEIKGKGYLVGNLFCNVILYTDDEIYLDDIISIDNEINAIVVNKNFSNIDYLTYCKGLNIIGSVNQEEVNILKKGKSIRKWLYQHNIKYENEWINQLLFSSNLDSDSNLKYLIVSSGMHISSLFMLVKKLLDKKFYQEESEKLLLGIEVIFGIIFHFPYGCVRSLLGSVLKILFKDKRDRTGLYIYLLALYKPYYCLSAAFLLPCLIRFTNCFNNGKLKNILLVILIQMYINGYCDLLSAVSFGLWRYLITILYCLGLCCCFLPVHIPFDLAKLLDLIAYKGIYLTNQIGIIILLVGVIILCEKKKMMLVAIILLINNYRNCFLPFYSVTYLDVGQADCALISMPYSKKALLIDTAGSNYTNTAKSIVIPYLLRNGFDKVDIIISHDDTDHSGNLEYLVNNFKVDNIYTKKEDIVVGKLKILSLNNDEYEDDNDNSLVNYFKINDYGFLFLADVSADVEERLVLDYALLDVDVCKISHHGSNSGTSEAFVSHFKIDYAIISCGKENVYHHPHSMVVNRLNAFKIKILQTNKDGALRFYIYKNHLLYISGIGTIGL